jgi:transcription initiation factor TFIID TATA-box-binding protein
MSGLAIPSTKPKPSPALTPSGSSNGVAGPSRKEKNKEDREQDEDEEMDKLGANRRPQKATVGVPEITAVAGLVPTLQ